MTSPEERLRELDLALGDAGRDAALLAALNDETTLVREHAIALAARYLQPEVLGRLIRDDANAVLRNAAQAALERQGPYATDHLIALTRDADPDVAMFAVQVLTKIAAPSTESALIPLLDHSDPNVAQATIEAMGVLGARAAVPRLIGLLDSDPWLQFAAVAALGQIGDARAVAPLLAHIGNEFLAEAVADALAQIASPEALRPLLAALCTGDRLPLRDRILLAVAAIVEQQRLPSGLADHMRRCLAAPRAGELNQYLRLVLELDDRTLARAAVVVILAAGVKDPLPALFVRACECPDDAAPIAALCQRFRSKLRPHLGWLLNHPDMRTRKGALLAAPLDRAAREAALAFLDDDDRRVRVAACAALARTPSVDAIPRLARLLLQGDAEEQEAAVEALSCCPGAALAPLASGLADGVSAEVQIACLRTLDAARSLLAREQVERLLGAEVLAVRRAALRVLANHPRPVLLGIAKRCFETGDTALAPDVIEHLSHRRSSSTVALLLTLLGGATELRYHVIRALGRLGDRAGVAPLIAVYAECERHERIEIASALVQIGTPECCAFLERRLEGGDSDLRRVAADGVARLAGPEHVPLLIRLAGDEDWVVRNHAAWGLGRLADPASRTALLTLARDVTPVVARAARAALAKIDAAKAGSS